MIRLPVVVRIYSEHGILIPKVKAVNICSLRQLVQRAAQCVERIVNLADRALNLPGNLGLAFVYRIGANLASQLDQIGSVDVQRIPLARRIEVLLDKGGFGLLPSFQLGDRFRLPRLVFLLRGFSHDYLVAPVGERVNGTPETDRLIEELKKHCAKRGSQIALARGVGRQSPADKRLAAQAGAAPVWNVV